MQIIVMNRSDRSARRLTNHAQLMAALRKMFPNENVVDFVGTKRKQEENVKLFREAKLVIGPHGGAFMNLM